MHVETRFENIHSNELCGYTSVNDRKELLDLVHNFEEVFKTIFPEESLCWRISYNVNNDQYCVSFEIRDYGWYDG